MARKNPEFCEVCGHVILDDDQEYCDWCGSEIRKEEVPDRGKSDKAGKADQSNKHHPSNQSGKSDDSSGSCLGSIGIALFIVLVIILLAVKR